MEKRGSKVNRSIEHVVAFSARTRPAGPISPRPRGQSKRRRLGRLRNLEASRQNPVKGERYRRMPSLNPSTNPARADSHVCLKLSAVKGGRSRRIMSLNPATTPARNCLNASTTGERLLSAFMSRSCAAGAACARRIRLGAAVYTLSEHVIERWSAMPARRLGPWAPSTSFDAASEVRQIASVGLTEEQPRGQRMARSS